MFKLHCKYTNLFFIFQIFLNKNCLFAGLFFEFKSKYDFKAKPILQYDIHGKFIKEWPSINDAEETLKIFSIGKCANLQRKSAGGYVWRYKNNGEEN